MAPHPWRPITQKRPRSDKSRDPKTTQTDYPPAAYIQAYESQLVYPTKGSSSGSGGGTGQDSSSLIKWSGGDEVDEGIWADRYNIIHLLPSLPSSSTAPNRTKIRAASPASSSSSWDDLPSDEEELFEISGDEAVETYEREKKRKWLDRLREERLKEREEQDGVLIKEDEAKAVAKAKEEDEIPDAIRTLMLHTAKSVYAAPNPKSLEMRILANHAGDQRFAFLRGRWNAEWEKVKRGVRVEKGLEKPEGLGADSVAMLGAYGSDSEDESEDGEGEEGREPDDPPPLPPPPPESPPDEPELGIEVGPGLGLGVGNSADKPELDEDSGRTMVQDRAKDGVDRLRSGLTLEEKELEEKQRMRREKLEEWKRKQKA